MASEEYAEKTLKEVAEVLDPNALSIADEVSVAESSGLKEEEQKEESNQQSDSTEEPDLNALIPNATETNKGYRICPRCHWDTTQLAPEITDDDVDLYLSYLFGMKPFQKTYEIRNGVKIVFEERSERVRMRIDAMIESWIIKEQVPVQLLTYSKLRMYQLATSLKRVEIGDKIFTFEDINDPFRYESYEEYNKAIADRFGQFNETLYVLLYRQSWEFEEFVQALIHKVADSNLA